MHIDPIHLIGAGGHGRVVADALIAAGCDADSIHVRDGRMGLTMLGRPVSTPEVVEAITGQWFHVAVGSAAIRTRLQAEALAAGGRALTVIHPSTVISAEGTLGAGVFIAANTVVAPGAVIGEGTIVNHGAVVDHDCRIGAFCHIAPNATLGGGVNIGNRVMIGAGAVVLPGISIGAEVVVGAGAVVLRSIDEPGTWVGNPARKLMK